MATRTLRGEIEMSDTIYPPRISSYPFILAELDDLRFEPQSADDLVTVSIQTKEAMAKLWAEGYNAVKAYYEEKRKVYELEKKIAALKEERSRIFLLSEL